MTALGSPGWDPGRGALLVHPHPFTYGGDHGACKEEAAAEVPVAGVGGVAFRVHAFHPGFHDDLWWGEEVA